jgi:fimbrial chaperone protein
MIVVQPGQRQMVRLVRVGTGLNPPAVEAAYRVVLDELPLQGDAQGVQFVLRYSIPIFVSPPEAASDGATRKPSSPALEWSLRRLGDDLFLTATNAGSEHAKLTEVNFSPRNGQAITLGDGLYGYVLPKATRHWNVTEHRAVSAGGTLNALVNEQAVAIPLAPAP